MIRLNRSEYGSLPSEQYMGSVVISGYSRFDRPMPLDKVRQALHDLTLAIPRMRANIVPTWRSYQLGIRPVDEWLLEDIESSLEVLPHMDADAPGLAQKLMERAINTPVLLSKGLPWFAWYVPHPTMPVLVLNIHHMVGDGTAIYHINKALYALLDGRSIETLPIESSSQLPGVMPAKVWQWPRSFWASIRNGLADAKRAKGQNIVTLATRQSDRYQASGHRQVDLPGGVSQARAVSKKLGTTINTLLTAMVAQAILARRPDDPKAVAVLRIAVDLRPYFPKDQVPRIGNYVATIEVRATHQPDLVAQVKSVNEQVADQLARFKRREWALPCLVLEALTSVISQGTLASLFLKMKASGALNKTSAFITNVGSSNGILPEGCHYGLQEYTLACVGPSLFFAVLSHGDTLRLMLSHQLDEIPRPVVAQFFEDMFAQYGQLLTPLTEARRA
jgi:hypothetical protein